ncbi:hypothetical protein LOK49_LG10G02109 [Camellia lanceoleosa]|uniref:Uncharacterized protein n=1 Tax=Camellia lanceoleosa TaxID=1840588 RepID=A0ACC0G7E5_9ERIC|nr:hypothetical protein LOK49_LG10G02109 [Camellia lanceoleosa]
MPGVVWYFHLTLYVASSSSDIRFQVMAAISSSCDQVEDEEEYVLLDLDGVSGQVDIPPNAPYVLSGLDTINPILVIDNKLKLIGEYEETIGTCFVFTEGEAAPVVHEETGPSEANLFSGKFIIDPKQAPSKEVKPIARLHKILRFSLLPETEVEDTTPTAKQTTT